VPILDFHPSGRHFLQIPGPSPVPDRVLRAISYPTIDHRGPEFGALGRRLLKGVKKVFQTEQPVIIYPSSGTGAWEAALVNLLSPGDHVLMYETGHFASLWTHLAKALQLRPEVIALPDLQGWRGGIQAQLIEDRLRADTARSIKAVCVVHNETSTGATSDIRAVRDAIDAAGHPALLLVDTISGLAAADYRHDEWGVDVSISGSQKGFMLPPGLGFNALSERARQASKQSAMPRGFWRWDEILATNATGYWPSTPSTNLLYGLDEALDLLLTEGLSNVFQRHQRLALACRSAVQAWGCVDILCQDARAHSPVLTSVLLPEGVDADQVRKLIYEHFNLSLGQGLGKLKGRIFRIGHLGDCNDLTLLATLAGCEMGLEMVGLSVQSSGVEAAMAVLRETARVPSFRSPAPDFP